jgi:hypothetical protein
VQLTKALSVSRDGQRRFYSRRLRTLHFALILFGTLVLALGPTSEFASDDPELFRRSCILVLIVGLTACWRVLRRGVVATPERVVVRNLLWFRVIPTANIESFGQAAGYGLHLGRGGMKIRTIRGKTIYASVFVTTPVDAGSRVGATEADELNAWLAAVRNGRRFPAGSLIPEWKAYGGVWPQRLWLLFLLGIIAFFLFAIVPALLDPASMLE